MVLCQLVSASNFEASLLLYILNSHKLFRRNTKLVIGLLFTAIASMLFWMDMQGVSNSDLKARHGVGELTVELINSNIIE